MGDSITEHWAGTRRGVFSEEFEDHARVFRKLFTKVCVFVFECFLLALQFWKAVYFLKPQKLTSSCAALLPSQKAGGKINGVAIGIGADTVGTTEKQLLGDTLLSRTSLIFLPCFFSLFILNVLLNDKKGCATFI